MTEKRRGNLRDDQLEAGMIEHTPWMGTNYEAGLNGQRIAIVGYSHHLGSEDGEDSADFTQERIHDIMSGALKISFFTQIRNYFGHENHDTFWPYVMFFNLIPNCIGDARRRYRRGESAQIEDGRSRFLRLPGKALPQKVLVFTGRHCDFPDTPCEKHGPDLPKFGYWRGTYCLENHPVATYFLRHPQGANGHLMRRAIAEILDQPVARESSSD
jgi:hypothetical protein